MKILTIIIFTILLLLWQGYEFYKYGDDMRLNIFSTGDYVKILKGKL